MNPLEADATLTYAKIPAKYRKCLLRIVSHGNAFVDKIISMTMYMEVAVVLMVSHREVVGANLLPHWIPLVGPCSATIGLLNVVVHKSQLQPF